MKSTFISSMLLHYHFKKPNLVHSLSDVNKSKDSVMKSDNNSVNIQDTIQAVQAELNKVRRNSFLKPYQFKACYIKTDQPKE